MLLERTLCGDVVQAKRISKSYEQYSRLSICDVLVRVCTGTTGGCLSTKRSRALDGKGMLTAICSSEFERLQPHIHHLSS